MSITRVPTGCFGRGSGGVEAGAQGGHQEVQGAAAAVPAGSPAPDGPPHAVIDRSRALTRIACFFFWFYYFVLSQFFGLDPEASPWPCFVLYLSSNLLQVVTV